MQQGLAMKKLVSCKVTAMLLFSVLSRLCRQTTILVIIPIVSYVIQVFHHVVMTQMPAWNLS